MNTVDSLECIFCKNEYTKLLNEYLKQKHYTNNRVPLKKMEYYIEQRRLFYIKKSGEGFRESTFFLVDMDNYYQLWYHLVSECDAPCVEKPIAVEIAYKRKEPEEIYVLNKMGFFSALSRIRLSRESYYSAYSNEFPAICHVSVADTSLIDHVSHILSSYFDSIVGYIPTHSDLFVKIQNGTVLCARINDKIAGILSYFSETGNNSLEHIAVLKEYRNRGVASCLIRMWLQVEPDTKRYYLWTAKTNIAAQELYRSFDFRNDGYQSIVLKS